MSRKRTEKNSSPVIAPSRRKSLVLVSLAGIAIFAFCFLLTGLPDFARLADFDIFWLCMAILAQGGFALAMPYRWKIVSAGARVHIPYLPAFKVSAYSSLAAAVIPQSLADLAGRGPWEARYTGCGILNAENIILCDRLLDVFIIAVLLPPSLLLAFEATEINMALCLAALMLAAGFATVYFLRGKFFSLFNVLFACVRWCFEKISFLRGKFNWQVSPIILSSRALALVYALSVLKFFIIAFATMTYFHVVNIEIPFFIIFLALPVTQFIFIFAFTPGGLGIFELGWAGILGLHGLGAENIAVFMVSQRICFTLGVSAWAAVASCLRGSSIDGKLP